VCRKQCRYVKSVEMHYLAGTCYQNDPRANKVRAGRSLNFLHGPQRKVTETAASCPVTTFECLLAVSAAFSRTATSAKFYDVTDFVSRACGYAIKYVDGCNGALSWACYIQLMLEWE
jgi:hypothetical protein